MASQSQAQYGSGIHTVPFDMWPRAPSKPPSRDQNVESDQIQVLEKINSVLINIETHIKSINPKEILELKAKIIKLENELQVRTGTFEQQHASIQQLKINVPMDEPTMSGPTTGTGSEPNETISTLTTATSPQQLPVNIETAHTVLRQIKNVSSDEHNATHSLINIFVFSILLPQLNKEEWKLRGKLPSRQWEHVYENLATDDVNAVGELTDILESLGLTINHFFWLIGHYSPECIPSSIDNKLWIILTYAPILGLIYSSPDNQYLQLFLACFGSCGEPRGWWEFLAGIKESYILEDGDHINNGGEWCISAANIVDAWTLQLQLGLCGIETEAVLNGDGIQLQWGHTHLVIAEHYAYLLDTTQQDPIRSCKLKRTATVWEMLDAALAFVGLNRGRLPRVKVQRK